MFYPLNVKDFLDRAETVYPDRVGVTDEPSQPAPSLGDVSYRALASAARQQAAWLDSLGVPVGGRVAMVSHNAGRMLTSFFGVSGWGRIFVPINFRLSAAEISYIVEHCSADVLLVDPELSGLLSSVTAKHTYVLGSSSDAEIFGGGGSPVPWAGDEAATCTLNYTSGTTARPKGVQLTHRANWLNATVFALHAGVSDRDVYLHTLPMFHANGWGMPYAMTGLGVHQVVLRKVDGAEILRRVASHGVTVMCAAPAVLNAVLDAASSWEGEIPGRDRVRVILAGAPPPTRTIERIRSDLGWEFIQIYGLTETAPILTVNRMRSEWDDLPASEQARLLGRAGAPALGVRLSVDGSGEVLAQANHNLDAYWENPSATAEAQEGNWFHTGDGGEFSDGYLSITDRKKDVIISGGENVSSIEVEDVLNSFPAVREVAVIGIPDEKWGELVTALVVTDGSDVSADEVIAFCRTKLAGYKCPKRVEFVGELPRTATGKLQKFKLREPFWEGRTRQVN
ncbi:AMP-binding protein [Cryptosporangium phraense]|uniref:AMP-binding protein n=1 Tax=Cryptosporangium phraense TaxID=2593070 RepID=A0A545AFT3_9ACTN|nr:AMP-binding protein [Cryptosporangium phraense]TQS40196.1 AMP-binding protein [Cryptosporangium phraense]